MTAIGTTILRIGNEGPEVGTLQRALNRALDARLIPHFPLIDDEDFGPKTEAATRSFQLVAFSGDVAALTGVLDLRTRTALLPFGMMPFVQAKHASILWPRRRTPTQIVIHTAECIETRDAAAESLALWAAGPSAPQASWHYAVDRGAIVQSVRDTDIAWHANKANDKAIGIEHAGYAAQTAAQWHDAPSTEILERSARLVAMLCRHWRIRTDYLSDAMIRAGRPGIFGHVDANRALGTPGHTDPGSHFPWQRYLDLVREVG